MNNAQFSISLTVLYFLYHIYPIFLNSLNVDSPILCNIILTVRTNSQTLLFVLWYILQFLLISINDVTNYRRQMENIHDKENVKSHINSTIHNRIKKKWHVRSLDFSIVIFFFKHKRLLLRKGPNNFLNSQQGKKSER